MLTDSKGRGLRDGPVCLEGGDDLLEGLVVEIVLRPSRDLVCLDLLPELSAEVCASATKMRALAAGMVHLHARGSTGGGQGLVG